MSDIYSAISFVKSVPGRFDSWLKENEGNAWLGAGVGLGSFAATWALYKKGVSSALKRDFEKACGFDVPIPADTWRELVSKNSPPPSQIWKQVANDLKPLVPTWHVVRYARDFWATALLLSRTTGAFTKSFLRLDGLWALNFILAGLQEAEYWVGGTALEGGLASRTSKLTGLNASWIVWPWMAAGFFGAQARRLYLMYHSQSLINALQRPTTQLCNEVRVLLPSPKPVPSVSPRTATGTEGINLEHVQQTAKAAVIGTAGALTVWAMFEYALAAAASAVTLFVPPGINVMLQKSNDYNVL